MTIETRILWLKAGSAITIAFGILMAAAALPALQYPTALLLDLIYLPVDGNQPLTSSPARLLSAISGGLMAGWGVMMWLVASELFAKDPALGRRLVLAGIGTWFIVDSSMSVAAGAPLNVLFNTGFLLVFFVPVWKPVAGHTAAAPE